MAGEDKRHAVGRLRRAGTGPSGKPGGSRVKKPIKQTPLVLPLLGNSKPGQGVDQQGNSDNPNHLRESYGKSDGSKLARPKTDRPRSAGRTNLEPVIIPPDELKDLRNIESLDERILTLRDKYYNGLFPTEGDGERFDMYKRQIEEIQGPKDRKPVKGMVEGEGEDDRNLAAGAGALGASGTALALGASLSANRNGWGRHFARFRGRRKPKPAKETRAARRARLTEERKAKLSEKERMRLGKGGQRGVTGVAATKGGEAAVKTGETALKGSKTVWGGVKGLVKGSKILRLGAVVGAGAVGLVAGTAALVGTVAVLGGAAVGLLAYKYGGASGERSIGQALKAGGNLLLPQEARNEFSAAGESFSKGNLWDGFKKGLAGCDEVLGLSAGLKWIKDQAVDFATNPADKMRRISSAVDTGIEAATTVAHNPRLRDSLLTAAGSAAAETNTAHSMLAVEEAVKQDPNALAFVKKNPALLGFAAMPKPDGAVPSKGTVAEANDDAHGEGFSPATSGWAPEPE